MRRYGSINRGNSDVTPGEFRARIFRGDHHDELGLLFLRGLAPEQQPENRDVANPGDLLQRLRRGVVEQARDRERLAVRQLDFRFGAAPAQRRDAGSPRAQWRC